jgi:hypothetical protein
MSQSQVDPEELAEQFGYKRGYAECESEMRFKITKVLASSLMKYCDPKPELSGLYASDLADRILKEVFDVK